MVNKCAKFHKDSPSGKKVKFNLARAIELSETTVFVYNFVLKPYRRKKGCDHRPRTVLNTSES